MIEIPSHLHPMVVHFPIALFIIALLFQIIGMTFKNGSFLKTSLYLYVLAALITPLVLRTGIWEAEKLSLNHPLLDKHRQMAEWTMWVSLMSLPLLWFVSREAKKWFQVIFLMFLIVTSVLVSFAADKGGRMVYEYGVGVE